MNSLFSFVLRVLLLLAGLVFAACLAVVFLLLVAVWVARSAWARLAGRRVAPFVMRVDPRRGFNDISRRGFNDFSHRPGSAAHAPPELGDVIDVQAKPPQG